jgi:uncharacterized protein YbjT (DUF2867 family)
MQTSPILVTGGTGTLGRLVVPRLRDAGRDVRVLSRHGGQGRPGLEFVTGDLATGEGLDAAVAGTEVVMHLAGSAKGDAEKARHLVRAASRAGVRHLVYISVVGADRMPMAGRIDRMMFGYFGAKHAAERIVAESGLPWTTLRATQFHDLIATSFAIQRYSPVLWALRGVSFQPIDPRDVARRLVELIDSDPSGRVPDIGGPTVHTHAELGRMYLTAGGGRRKVVAVPIPGRIVAAYRSGAHLAPQNPVGTIEFADYLAGAE